MLFIITKVTVDRNEFITTVFCILCFCHDFIMFVFISIQLSRPRAGSGVVRIDPLRFLAGCRTRRLNQA